MYLHSMPTSTPPQHSGLAEYLSLQEVADLLCIHRETLYKMARSGKFPASKVGGLWRIDRETLSAWVESKAVA